MLQSIRHVYERLIHSLYWKISAFLFLIFVLLGTVYTVVSISIAKRYSDETTQKLNTNVAAHLLKEVHPFVDGKVNEASLDRIMHSMMAVNPSLEVYLLDPGGTILSSVVLHEKVNAMQIPVGPIREFVTSKGRDLLYGADPRHPGKTKIFSAAAVYDKKVLQGYVYLILGGEKLDDVNISLLDNYVVRIGVQSFLITVAAAFVIALLVLWLSMRSLQNVIETVKRIGSGDLTQRIAVTSKGELSQLSSTINDMAETMVQNMEELKKVDSLRRDLIANVSHDIRTPVSIIHGYIETMIIQHSLLDARKQEEYLQVVLKSIVRLKQLIDDLFELSKLESRQVAPVIERFFIGDLLQDLTLKYRLLTAEKSIRLELNAAAEMPVVLGDVAMIDRVLQNLMDNAINYTPSGGTILISMTVSKNVVRIGISNSGPEIQRDELSRIFNRYYKTDGTQNSPGTGLGLAIVKNILEIHQSEIRVRRDPPGFTTFYFDLNEGLR